MPRAAPQIDLTEADRTELERLARSLYTPQGLAARARIVLAAAEGLSNQQIAEKLYVSEATVGRWRKDYSYWRGEGLRSLYHGGRPRKYDRKTEERLADLVRHRPPGAKQRWTVRDLANYLQLPPSTVQDLLCRVKLPRSRYLPWRRMRA